VNVEVLLFDGFDELDAVGPYEVLANGGRMSADLSASTVTLEPEEMVVAGHGLTVVPDGQLGRPDLLVVPGGGWTTGGGVSRVVEDGDLPRAVADRHADGTAVASVCTGAMILAAAGLLDGRPATTHHVAHDDVAEVADLVDARVVDDGEVVTAAGVTSGIDMGLWLLEREFGADVASRVEREMEYERRGDVYRG